ncbi:hypothetical protein [Streptomyces sp. NPDC093094]|uniref:hypothetical protein n=1 Tax=Streptomyces sp. NPDC093094 TaxID=3366026 RepID=UPI0037F23A2A
MKLQRTALVLATTVLPALFVLPQAQISAAASDSAPAVAPFGGIEAVAAAHSGDDDSGWP